MKSLSLEVFYKNILPEAFVRVYFEIFDTWV